ncbi:MAG: hypothetical protein EVA89_23170 [Sandaracinaceae bacterium]|nr:MAG: hypothetical protein EVA89_23170 [Sandaracinaceae bacterium]
MRIRPTAASIAFACLFSLTLLRVSVARAQDATSLDDPSDETGSSPDVAAPPVPDASDDLPEPVYAPGAPTPPAEEPLALPPPLGDELEGPAVGEAAPLERSRAIDLATSSPRTLLGRQAAVWGELGVTGGGPTEAQVTLVTAEVGLRYRLEGDFVMHASWGLALADADVRGEESIGGAPTEYDASVFAAQPGNPVLGSGFDGALGDARFSISGALAIPAAARAELGRDADTLAGRAASEASHRAVMSMRGYWGAWRWAPERLGLVVPVRLAIPVDRVTLEADGGLAVLVPILGDSLAETDVILQLAAGADVRIAGPLSAGARLRLVGGASGSTVPGAVASLEPFAALRFDEVHVTLRGNVNFNGDDGVAGPRGPGWGLWLASGLGF